MQSPVLSSYVRLSVICNVMSILVSEVILHLYVDYGELLSFFESFKQDCSQVRMWGKGGGGIMNKLMRIFLLPIESRK